jgi:hypothetical protein
MIDPSTFFRIAHFGDLKTASQPFWAYLIIPGMLSISSVLTQNFLCHRFVVSIGSTLMYVENYLRLGFVTWAEIGISASFSGSLWSSDLDTGLHRLLGKFRRSPDSVSVLHGSNLLVLFSTTIMSKYGVYAITTCDTPLSLSLSLSSWKAVQQLAYKWYLPWQACETLTDTILSGNLLSLVLVDPLTQPW